MKLHLLKSTYVIRTILTTSTFWMLSCWGTESSVEGNGTTHAEFNVKINLAGIESEGATSSVNTKETAVGTIQKSIIPLGGGSFITATLTPAPASSLKNTAQASVNPMASTSVLTELAKGTQYKVMVYDSNGNLSDQKIFTYGQKEDGFKLTGNQKYTFVAYSLNTTSVPNADNGGTLGTSKLSAVNGDLMYFKKEMTVSANEINYLNVVLKHQFSQITTKLDARQVGTISAVSNAAITPASTSADISFDTNTITYGTPAAGGAKVNFPVLNSSTATSPATQIIANTTANGQLNIDAVTIDGVTRNVKMDNVNITPGVKYNLNIRFGPCREDVTPTPFNLKNGETKTFDMPATDFGFVLDLYTLDNSFNMNINGVQLATKEIQFEKDSKAPVDLPQNIQFQDGTSWDNGSIPAVYQMTGTASAPLIRVVISKDGKISMFGSKVSGGSLFPLALKNNSFNTITWNTAGTNKVIISQKVLYTTYMTGAGTGKRIVTCTP